MDPNPYPVCPERLDPDPDCPERLDPDPNPVCPEMMDPDPVNIRPDPKPCQRVTLVSWWLRILKRIFDTFTFLFVMFKICSMYLILSQIAPLEF